MHQIVRQQFLKFSNTLEGDVTWMYLDVKGLVTTGRGNLIDRVEKALALKWEYRGRPGSEASEPDVRAEWNHIKNDEESKAMKQGGGGRYKRITKLDVNSASLERLYNDTLLGNEATLKTVFHPPYRPYADFDDLPADAQLGLLSLAWAAGPAFSQDHRWPRFVQAIVDRDWDEAAAQSRLSETDNAPIWKRNVANSILFRNAGIVWNNAGTMPFDVLYYPTMLFGPATAREAQVLSEF